VQKPEKLAAIAAEMNKVVQSRPENEGKTQPQVIVYAPQIISESHFQTLVVKE